MRNQLYYDGKALSDFGVYVSGDGVYNAPEKDYTVTEVPGRNGDIYSYNKRYRNISVTYPAFIIGKDRITGSAREDFALRVQGLRAWLNHADKYCRISDTYHPDQYRMGIHSVEFVVTEQLLRAGEFDLTFQCKPQRFLTAGEVAQIFTESGGALDNPFFFEAQPHVRVYGYGVLYIGDYGIQIAQSTLPYVDIDCERMDAYYGTINCNNMIALESDFPRLGAGRSVVTFGSTITRVEITPRWWTL